MNLNHYYAENKDRINSSIMEIASDLAVGCMVDKYKQPFEAFVEPDDPDDPDSGTHYKEEFQDEYDKFYDEEYERVASLMRFDIGTEDGIRRDGTDDPIVSLVSRANAWQKEARERIVETLRRHGGRVPTNRKRRTGSIPLPRHSTEGANIFALISSTSTSKMEPASWPTVSTRTATREPDSKSTTNSSTTSRCSSNGYCNHGLESSLHHRPPRSGEYDGGDHL